MWDPRLENRDTYFTWDLRLETHYTERGICNTYDRWDPRPKTNISCRTWDARTMIQMHLIKCPINMIWVVIFLIFIHSIKRLQHFQQISFFYYNKFDLNVYKTYIPFLRKHLYTLAFCILTSNQFRETYKKPPVLPPRFY